MSSKTIELKGYAIGFYAPWAESVLNIQVPIKKEDIVNARKAIDDVITWIDEADKKWKVPWINEKLVKRRKRGRIIQVGSGDRAKLMLELMPFPTHFYLIPEKARYVFTSWLYKNSVKIRARPENIYIVSEARLKNLANVVVNINSMLNEGNRLIHEFWSREGRNRLMEILERNNIVCDVNKLSPRRFHEFRVMITPIKLSYSLVRDWIMKDPNVAYMFQETINSYMQSIIDDIRSKLEHFVNSVLENRNVRVKNVYERVKEIRTLARELGIESLVSVVVNDVLTAVTNPEGFRMKYRDIESWRKDIDARIASLI